jgi:hypothetical protein
VIRFSADHRFTRFVLLAAGLPSLLLAGGAQETEKKLVSPENTAKSEFFENRVRPILQAHCVSCHGEAVQQGGLRLDTREGFLKGGKRGPVLAPEKPAESLLLQVVTNHPTLKMPPNGPLKPQQITALTEWVRTGATWPEYAGKPKQEHQAALWSLRSVRKPPVPKTKNQKTSHQPPTTSHRNPIDAFILQKLDANGLTPAPPATKVQLMRRAYFDLIGLPPTPQEIAAYLADRSPNAYEKLLDRLLASPHYGERWSRYWLDLVRFADTNGYERDDEKPYAWKYRDYVIRSLNQDKPYNRFVTEQLAGDELPDRNEETVTATAFLRIGTWDDEPNDPLEYKYDRLDDLVHATTSAFLGFTVRCARCHDHKFDPISQKDYYAIANAFAGGYLEAGDRKLMGGPPPEKLGYATLGFTEKGRDAPTLRLLKNGNPHSEGEAVPPGFLSMVTQVKREVVPPPPDAKTSTRRLQLARWITDPAHPLTARLFVNRLWQHHFGQGLVRTPNNFGSKGAPPTHPELLDWLAADFVAHGWKTKRMHRMIMLSNAYRMASIHPQQTAYERKDALNRFLWRAHRRRLDADAMRDSILTVSGDLNPKMGGPGFLPAVPQEVLEGLSKKGAEWNPSAPDEQRRRSVYMYLKRALLLPLLTVFDFGDTTAPLEQRDVTTVAPQALSLLNNPFVHQQSDVFARRIEKEVGADRVKQIERAWRLAFGRAPTTTESRAALAYLQRTPAVPRVQAPVTGELTATQAIRLWLRADKGVQTDANGKVTAWADQSKLGFQAVQAVGDAQPTLIPEALRGQPALRFDGKDDFLGLVAPVLTSQQFSIFAVASDRAPNESHREIFSNWRREDNVGTSVFLGTTGAATVRFTDYFTSAGILSRPQQPFILTGIADTGSVTVSQNRTEMARLATSLVTRNLAPPYVIGQQGNINGEFWNGDIFEILVFDRALSAVECEQVWDMLNHRYGLAPRVPTADAALASLCRVLMNANEFLYVD